MSAISHNPGTNEADAQSRSFKNSAIYFDIAKSRERRRAIGKDDRASRHVAVTEEYMTNFALMLKHR
jgi:hypothetical protein